ncbi:unnamed protein product, partial [Didymodactylos carnosus]
ADIDLAVQAARRAFDDDNSEWRKLEPSARASLLTKFAEYLIRDIDYLAKLETLNSGKPIMDSYTNIHIAADIIRYYAGYWNVPIVMLALKLGPALACGNTCILKPAEQTPLTALYCASLIKEAKFPNGVVNIVPGNGSDCGHSMVVHNGIDKISFTGSLEVGKQIQQEAATNLKLVSLELGGKSP